MDTFERNATRALAIAYHAYMNAGADNWQPWAKLLIQAQRDTGIELLPVSTLLYSPPATNSVDAYWAGSVSTSVMGDCQSGNVVTVNAGKDDDEGGALVPAPKPPPRKPSPGASIAAQAARFYATR